jgi:hypothetical protein
MSISISQMFFVIVSGAKNLFSNFPVIVVKRGIRCYIYCCMDPLYGEDDRTIWIGSRSPLPKTNSSSILSLYMPTVLQRNQKIVMQERVPQPKPREKQGRIDTVKNFEMFGNSLSTISAKDIFPSRWQGMQHLFLVFLILMAVGIFGMGIYVSMGGEVAFALGPQ